VAVPTVYASVGSKQELVVALNDLIDEQADVAPIARRLSQSDDPLELLALAVRLTRQMNECCDDIIGAPKSASARPGPCTRPRSADALTRREYHPARQTPASRSFVLGRQVAGELGRPGGALAACGRSTLTPGRARWSR
jgi:hypothetical protein